MPRCHETSGYEELSQFLTSKQGQNISAFRCPGSFQGARSHSTLIFTQIWQESSVAASVVENYTGTKDFLTFIDFYLRNHSETIKSANINLVRSGLATFHHQLSETPLSLRPVIKGLLPNGAMTMGSLAFLAGAVDAVCCTKYRCDWAAAAAC